MVVNSIVLAIPILGIFTKLMKDLIIDNSCIEYNNIKF